MPGLEIERWGGDDHVRAVHPGKEEVHRLTTVQPLHMSMMVQGEADSNLGGAG